MADSTVLEDLDVKVVSTLNQEQQIPMEDLIVTLLFLLHNVPTMHAVELMKMETQQLDLDIDNSLQGV